MPEIRTVLPLVTETFPVPVIVCARFAPLVMSSVPVPVTVVVPALNSAVLPRRVPPEMVQTWPEPVFVSVHVPVPVFEKLSNPEYWPATPISLESNEPLPVPASMKESPPPLPAMTSPVMLAVSYKVNWSVPAPISSAAVPPASVPATLMPRAALPAV